MRNVQGIKWKKLVPNLTGGERGNKREASRCLPGFWLRWILFLCSVFQGSGNSSRTPLFKVYCQIAGNSNGVPSFSWLPSLSHHLSHSTIQLIASWSKHASEEKGVCDLSWWTPVHFGLPAVVQLSLGRTLISLWEQAFPCVLWSLRWSVNQIKPISFARNLEHLDSGTKTWLKEIKKCVSAVTWVSRPSLLPALSTTKLFSLSFDFVIYPVSFQQILFLIYLVSVACNKGTLANA